MSATGLHARFRGRVGSFQLDAAFVAPSSGVTALFGPSGCGKTSLLRCIAGLNRFADGYCALDSEVWQDGTARFAPTYRRPIGYVFQEASLFPHMSVRRNLLYGAPRTNADRIAIGYDEVIELFGLADLLERSPRNLSGGERQRVALGRALLSQPRLLLMDEPLSALDATAKEDILPYLERLHGRLSLPVVYVTHDMREVERLADHLVLMEKGRVVAAGQLGDLLSDPSLPFARAREAAVMLEINGREREATGRGNGQVDALYTAVDALVDIQPRLEHLHVEAVTSSADAQGSVLTRVRVGDEVYTGHAVSTDIISASLDSYIQAINRALADRASRAEESKASKREAV